MTLWIDGEWIQTSEQAPVTNKYTGEVIGYMSIANRSQVHDAVTAAKGAMQRAPLSSEQRYDILMEVSRQLKSHHEELAMLVAREGGKPYKEAHSEVERAMRTFVVAAEEAKRLCGEMVPIASHDIPGKLAFTIQIPVGVVCAISPFNFPINLVAHKIAPAIAAGNAFVLKPASYTPLTALRLCQILEAAGLPKGYGNLITGGGSTVGEWLLDEDDIAFYTFTGSPAIGKHLKERIGLRRCTLELGSNSATIVHADGDIKHAAKRCARSAFGNAGQICISVQRVFVQDAVFDAFMTEFVQETQLLKVGNPTDPETDVGPLIHEREAERAMKWIEEAVQAGATLETGGKREGAIIRPTILSNVREEQKVCCEEAFAPLVVVNRYSTLDEAIGMVNNSKYGLQGGLFTQSLDVMLKCAREIEVGGLMVNETSSYRSDEMPYGGVKESGIGREGPKYTIQEMTESKLIVIH